MFISSLDYKLSECRVLSAKEERELLERFKKGDNKALDTLIKSQIKLVFMIASKYIGCGVPFEDLIQEGCAAVLRSIRQFNLKKNVRLNTYVYPAIKNAMEDTIAKTGRTIGFSVITSSAMNKLKRAGDEYYVKHGREATEAELSKITGISEKRIRKFKMFSVTSLNELVNDEGTTERMDLLKDENTANEPTSIIEKEYVRSLMTGLKERERKVLYLRYGLFNGNTYNYREISHILGISHERVRQIEKEAIKKMRAKL